MRAESLGGADSDAPRGAQRSSAGATREPSRPSIRLPHPDGENLPAVTSSAWPEQVDTSHLERVQGRVMGWFRANGRDLPMRRPEVSAWGTVVFEVMSQQTPIPRVQPIWERWMERWPTPAALSQARSGDVLVAWDRLGYPSRALRLKECASYIVEQYEGEVPSHVDDLLKLPGIGPYTASAVSSFHYHQRLPVLDTNVRRVIGRIFTGQAVPPSSSPTRAEIKFSWQCLPEDAQESAEWNVSVMELGALVCTSRKPTCHACPVADLCTWKAFDCPPPTVTRKSQGWKGSDRQARGQVMALLRRRHSSGEEGRSHAGDTPSSLTTYEELLEAASLADGEETQAQRVINALVQDGLIRGNADTGFCLP